LKGISTINVACTSNIPKKSYHYPLSINLLQKKRPPTAEPLGGAFIWVTNGLLELLYKL